VSLHGLPGGADVLTVDLYPYQEEAVDLVLDLGYGLVGYEMGLGKTIVGIAVVEELLAEPAINFAMIVVPSGLKYQWAKSIAKFTDVKTKQKKVKDEFITIPEDKYCVVVDGTPASARSSTGTSRRTGPTTSSCRTSRSSTTGGPSETSQPSA
jgi:superfamily II DNA or RNA helicase